MIKQIAQCVEFFGKGDTDTLFVKRSIINKVIVGTIIGFKLQLTRFIELDKNFDLTDNRICCVRLQITVVSNVSVDRNPIVEYLGT